ncbi:MAG: hypothetical protein JWO30_1521 [Fibrobacteres bacterium]|nr:hypothetical protein [Fibrobacterota bacterium]
MFNRKIVGLVIAQTFLAASIFAAADKACLKSADDAYKTELAGCKDMKGAEKKTCKKTAKDNKTKAKAACSAPAAAPAAPAEPAPAAQ